ncbi:hypothetical protein WJX81_007095 [Elliptochloris bilobata]|uniref:Uncharacterized protein n=1 Tax=Elliptochloris bilobata TaxID=381761 RepID=A0AAW1QN84_9CHLO
MRTVVREPDPHYAIYAPSFGTETTDLANSLATSVPGAGAARKRAALGPHAGAPAKLPAEFTTSPASEHAQRRVFYLRAYATPRAPPALLVERPTVGGLRLRADDPYYQGCQLSREDRADGSDASSVASCSWGQCLCTRLFCESSSEDMSRGTGSLQRSSSTVAGRREASVESGPSATSSCSPAMAAPAARDPLAEWFVGHFASLDTRELLEAGGSGAGASSGGWSGSSAPSPPLMRTATGSVGGPAAAARARAAARADGAATGSQ